MDRSYSNVPVLFIHEEKGTSNISPNPTLELLFAKNARANRSKISPTVQQQDPNCLDNNLKQRYNKNNSPCLHERWEGSQH
jgi:hypothetical protein